MYTTAICLILSLFSSALGYREDVYRRHAYPDAPNPHSKSGHSAGPKSGEQDNSILAHMAYAKQNVDNQLLAHDSDNRARSVYPLSVHYRRASRHNLPYPRLTSTLSRRMYSDSEEYYSASSAPDAPFKHLRGRPPPHPQRGITVPIYPNYPSTPVHPAEREHSPPLSIKQGGWRTIHPQHGVVQRTSPLAQQMSPSTPQLHPGPNFQQLAAQNVGIPQIHYEHSLPPAQAHDMHNVPASAFEMASWASAERQSGAQLMGVDTPVTGAVTRSATAKLQAQIELEQSGKRKSDEIYPGYMLDIHMAPTKKKKEERKERKREVFQERVVV